LVEVISRPLAGTTVLPGELRAYRSIEIHAKVSGFLDSVRVDRGSRVRKGDLLATVAAPEMDAQIAEARARAVAAEAQRAEAEAGRAAAENTLDRLREAARTQGAVAGNDLVLADRALDANRARVASADRGVEAAKAALSALEAMHRYRRVEAEFDGLITERLLHEGSLVGPQSKGAVPLFKLEQVGRLRLVVAVPEVLAGTVKRGTTVQFTVPAYPGEKSSGVVARPALSVDPKTRTMPVELDVRNSAGLLAPGMYAEVAWPQGRGRESLLVPVSAIKATTERLFVIRVVGGVAEWVDVRRGAAEGNLVEVFAHLKPGDKILQRATDEVRPGTRISPQ
jgi:RND family efflux transporter MFP subunit